MIEELLGCPQLRHSLIDIVLISPLDQRFDVRGYLNDLSQFQTRAKFDYDMTPEEMEIERLCDEERFGDLRTREQNDIDDNHDEELKRLHLALAEGSGYNEINYDYDQSNADQSQTQTTETVTSEEEPKIDENDKFKLPSGLSPPEGMILPESQKLHIIIEKTALFVSQHGLQMEIILKTKQSNNRNFEFLNFDSPLQAYYKYLLECIKSRKYVPNQSQNSDSSSDTDDSDDEHYLHPSLLGSAKNKESNTFKIPHLLRAANPDDAYSKLVKSLKDLLPAVDEPNVDPSPPNNSEPTFKQTLTSVSSDSYANQSNAKEKTFGTTISQNTWSSLLPSPPPDIEQIIEKLAQKVALSGEKFELSIKNLGESRFEFVNPGHIYHAHYIRRKLHYLEEHRSAQAAQLKLGSKKIKTEPQGKLAFSFSINPKESKPTKGPTDENLLTIGSSTRVEERTPNPDIVAKRMIDNALKDKLALAVRDKAAKEKQEERKRKVALFVSSLKSKELNKSVDSNQVNKDRQSTYKSDSKTSGEDKEPLSPTIAAVTSPNASPERLRSKENDICSSETTNKSLESAKSGSLLPFTASDKPLKESSSSRRSPHRHHKSRHSSGHKSHKRKSRSRSRSSSRSPSRSHRKRSKRSKSRSRSRSRSRSHRRR